MRFNVDALVEENKRLKRAVEELSLLNKLAQTIGASSNLDAILQEIIKHSLRAVQAEQCTITLVVEKSDSPLKTLVRTMVRNAAHEAFHLNQVLLGWMMKHKRPLSLTHPQKDDRFPGIEWDTEIHSLLCVPLLIKSRLIGILTAFNKLAGNQFTAEDLRLLGIIAAQSAQIIENARLAEEEKVLICVKEEMNLARQIQKDLLPHQLPEIPGYAIRGTSIPAESVGGDYFDFIPLDAHRLVLCLGDVSGKGLPAALLMSNLQAIIRSQLYMPGGVAEWVQRANQLLYHNTSPSKFATLFLAVLDFHTHRLHYANAGHDRPLVISADGTIQELPEAGVPLGFLEKVLYQEQDFAFKKGDTLLVYSDGVSEAMNEKEEEFGVARIRSFLARNYQRSAAEIIRNLVAQVHHHAGKRPQSDDITVILVQRNN